jgi:hypothetical protein
MTTNTPQLEETAKGQRQPIWSFNPAVPLAARICTYLFWGLICFVTVKSCTNVRPGDIPLYPKQWKVYQNSQGVSLPYPESWKLVDRSDKKDTDVTVALPPFGQVRVQLGVHHFTDPIDPATVDIAGDVARQLRTEFPVGYTDDPPDAALPDGWHAFHADDVQTPGLSIKGAWAANVNEDRIFFVEATSSPAGWKVTRNILSYMLAHASY